MKPLTSLILCACLFATRLEAQSSFIALSDIHLDSSNTKYWKEAAKEVTQLAMTKKPAFILYLGDLPEHANPNSSAEVAGAMKQAGLALQDLRGISEQSGIPLVYVPGNDDSYTGDYHVFDTALFKLDPTGANRWPLISGKKPASHWNNPYIVDQSLFSLGCYAAAPMGRQTPFRILVLNTVMFCPQDSSANGRAYNYSNDHPELRQQHTNWQMAWLSSQLQAAKDSGIQILIAMHVPPGRDGYTGSNSTGTAGGKLIWDDTLKYQGKRVEDAFVSMLSDYKDNIVGVIGSHTHLDGIRAILGENNSPILPYISVPGISADHGNNSSFKVVDFAPAPKYALTNFTTHYYRKANPAIRYDSTYTYNSTFENTGGLSIIGDIQSIYAQDKSNWQSRLSVYLDRIYSTNNGPSYSISNDSQVTLYIRSQNQ